MGIVVVRETEWTSPFRPELSTPAPTFGAALMVGEATPKFVYCLYHEKNKEIYLPKENERYQKPIGNNYSNRLCSKMNALIFVGIDEDWMKEAKLVALETVPIGRGKFQYEIPNDQILPLILSQTDQNKE